MFRERPLPEIRSFRRNVTKPASVFDTITIEDVAATQAAQLTSIARNRCFTERSQHLLHEMRHSNII